MYLFPMWYRVLWLLLPREETNILLKRTSFTLVLQQGAEKDEESQFCEAANLFPWLDSLYFLLFPHIPTSFTHPPHMHKPWLQQARRTQSESKDNNNLNKFIFKQRRCLRKGAAQLMSVGSGVVSLAVCIWLALLARTEQAFVFQTT